jgi:hypothetical protein
MPINVNNQVDFLFKKIGYGVATTAVASVKSPSNESIASPLTLRGDIIWQQASAIPGVQPASTSGVVTTYNDGGSNTIATTVDATAPAFNTYKTNLTNWIDPSFGSTYQVKVYLATTGSSNPQTTGTQIFPDGTGNDDEWFFDYSAGVLNFPDNIPTIISGSSGKTIYVAGARYTGQLGISTFVGNIAFGNISVSGTSALNTVTATTATVTNATFTTLQAQILGGVTPGIGNFTSLTTSSATTLGATTAASLDYTPIGNVSPNSGTFTLLNASGTATLSGRVLASNSTASTSTTTGAVVVTGGVGIGGATYIGGTLSVAGNASVSNLSTNITTLNTIAAASNNIILVPSATGVVTMSATTAVGVPSGSTSARPTGVAGYLRFNTDTSSLEYYTGTTWVGLSVGISDQQLTPDGTSTTYTLVESSTTVGVLVSINGTVQAPFTAYTVTNNQITFTEVLATTDNVDIRFISSTVVPDLTNYSGTVAITGNMTLNGLFGSTPATKTGTSTGTVGQICWDANFVYVCTATNTWKRTALVSF